MIVLRVVVTVTSFGVCVFCATLWKRSYSYVEMVQVKPVTAWSLHIHSESGRMQIFFIHPWYQSHEFTEFLWRWVTTRPPHGLALSLDTKQCSSFKLLGITLGGGTVRSRTYGDGSAYPPEENARYLFSTDGPHWSPPLRAQWIELPHFVSTFVSGIIFLLGAARFTRFIAREQTRRVRIMHGQCPTCGYDLRASAARCPECGWWSDPKDHYPN
jgi:hypothetical protein